MDPLTISSLIGAGGSLASGALNLFGQGQQQQNNQQALQMAMQNYQLQKQQADRQYELNTAGQTDARGNTTTYVPGKGWVTQLTPLSQNLVGGSDAVQGLNNRLAVTTGRQEREAANLRRGQEGAAASPLLAQMANQYGAPTREGVVGADKIAGVTSASEGADQARGGFNAAALRTGSGSVPLQNTLASLDRGATSGIRSAMARSDANAGPLFQQMQDQYTASKINPYNTLASRASNVDNTPFQPESITGGLDTVGLNRAAGAGRFGAQSTGTNQAIGPLLAAMTNQRMPNYDTAVAGLTANLKNIIPGLFNKSSSTGNPDKFTAQTMSDQTYGIF